MGGLHQETDKYESKDDEQYQSHATAALGLRLRPEWYVLLCVVGAVALLEGITVRSELLALLLATDICRSSLLLCIRNTILRSIAALHHRLSGVR